ncbi:hypothetical protein [[Clostridium] scindens]|uniref:hypothetical protein n=1 Tax=Clostridium scindens (strain JCM 10418 / VPI 12708) TaxID=29347 RepID=UPI0039F61F23
MYNMQLNTGYAGKPHVTAENCADLNRGIVGSDSYVLPVGAQFEVELVTNNLLKIKDGCGCMQGRQVSIAKGQTDEITIENGTQGEKRIDLVVIRYSKNADTGIETAIPFLVKGIPSENNPVRPEHLEGDIRGGDLTADWPLYELYLDGISVTNVKPLFDVLMSVDSLNRKFVFKRRNSSEAGICTPHYIMIMGTLVLQGANADYRQLFSTSDLLSKLKFYDPSISNFEAAKCVVTTNNGDGNAAATHFYAPEWWGSNNAYYQYFYPGTSSPIRVNYCIHYLKL